MNNNWEVYAGLVDDLGGVMYYGLLEDTQMEDALEYAQGKAYEVFQKLVDSGKIHSLDDCYKQALLELDKDDYVDQAAFFKAAEVHAQEMFDDIRDSVVVYYLEEEEVYDDDLEYYDEDDEDEYDEEDDD